MLIISDFIGCKDTAYKTIRVDSLTEIHLSFNDSNICAGEEVRISATYADVGSTGAMWDFGDGIVKTTFDHTIDHSYERPGVYTIKMTATGRVCPDVEATLPLNVQSQPVINLGPDTAMCPSSAPVVINDLINGSNPAAKWQWKRDNELQGETSFTYVAKDPAMYTALVTVGECTSADTIWIKNDCYIDMPNAFTPDGDNLDDYFFPRQWLSKGVTSFKLLVFNRWGQEIFNTTNISGRGWDGRFNGVDQPVGVYVYTIEAKFKDGTSEKKQGNVTLLR
jgi:gliding motility-associated-like protein